MMIVDAADERSSRPTPHKQTSSSSLKSNGSGSAPPPVPKKPAKVISEEDYEPVRPLTTPDISVVDVLQENPNEIIVGTNTNIDEHVARSVGLLEVSRVFILRLTIR